MLHQPSTQFEFAPPQSRVVRLAHEYDRWFALYDQVGKVLDGLPQGADSDKEDVAIKQAVRRMHEIMDELTMTRARDLRDFGLKARIIREFQTHDWYAADAKLDYGESLARSMMIELMEINDLPPIERPDFEPKEVHADFVEPKRVAVAASTPHCTTDSSTCACAALGRRSQQVLQQLDRVEGGDLEAFNRDRQITSGNRLMNGFAEAAVHSRAVSAEGVLFQVIAAYDLAVVAANCEDAKDDKQDISLLLWSIRNFLESHFGIDGRNVGGDFWMPHRLNPALALADAARASVQPILQAAE